MLSAAGDTPHTHRRGGNVCRAQTEAPGLVMVIHGESAETGTWVPEV